MEQQMNGTPTMSESLKAVLSRPPSFLMRYGTLLLIMAFTAVVAAGFLITYPNKVQGHLSLTTNPSPIPVLATSDGLINRFTVEEGGFIRKDSIIAVYASNALLKDVNRLEAEITQLQNYNRDSLGIYKAPVGLELGTLAPKYTVTRQLLSSFTENTNGDSYRNNNTVYRSIRGKINSTIRELK
ncbi:MAG TPA: hypothetical protein VKP88_08865, partial [Candidatus Paceibacterota bacterium]|nr:hypothetical protein [Candidatus Paceibacterota bacterium]